MVAGAVNVAPLAGALSEIVGARFRPGMSICDAAAIPAENTIAHAANEPRRRDAMMTLPISVARLWGESQLLTARQVPQIFWMRPSTDGLSGFSLDVLAADEEKRAPNAYLTEHEYGGVFGGIWWIVRCSSNSRVRDERARRTR